MKLLGRSTWVESRLAESRKLKAEMEGALATQVLSVETRAEMVKWLMDFQKLEKDLKAFDRANQQRTKPGRL